jgi:hypothetical protein
MWSDERQPAFRRNILPLFSGFKCKPAWNTALLAACFMLLSCLAYFSTLKLEEIRSSETSVGFNPTTPRYIAKDRNPRFLNNVNIVSTVELPVLIWPNTSVMSIFFSSGILLKNILHVWLVFSIQRSIEFIVCEHNLFSVLKGNVHALRQIQRYWTACFSLVFMW